MKIAMRNRHKLKWQPSRGTAGSQWGELFGTIVPEGVRLRAHNNPNKNGKSYKWTVYATFGDGERNSMENTRTSFKQALETTLEGINNA